LAAAVPFHPDADLKACDEVDLYYGFGKPPDYAGAMKCGIYQRAHPDPTRGDPFAGPGILSMIYANGKTGIRDYDPALKFICENTWAGDVEKEARLEHIEQMRAGKMRGDFDLCDDATSGLMQGACEGIRQGFADAQRDRETSHFEQQLSEAARRDFAVLRRSSEEFIAARIRNEVDLSGTRRGAFELTERGILRDQFLINLRRFSTGDVPRTSPREAQDIDQRLNDAYARALAKPAAGTVNAGGIQNTESAWVALRKQWISFARVAWPTLPEIDVGAQITRLRAHQLESLAK